MSKLFIPPKLIFYSIILMSVFYLFFPQLNLIPFPLNLAGLGIAFSGFFIMGKARELFARYDTTLKIEESSHLITEGVFSRTRNPMYLGMFILLLGLSILSTSILALLLPLTFIVVVRWIFIGKEEQLMSDTFGEEYTRYRQSVRRWI